jgi:hypothetical protein
MLTLLQEANYNKKHKENVFSFIFMFLFQNILIKLLEGSD